MTEKQGPATSVEQVEAREREWLQKTFRGGVEPELTVRSIVLGVFIGAIMSLSNLYVGFKMGWGLGVTITAAIMAFALFKALRTTLPFFVKRDMGILETNILVTIASACAFIASAGLSNAVPALTMVSGQTLPSWKLALWVAVILFLGLFMAIPMKRQMINVEDLKFPTGFATSEVLKGMYTSGGDAVLKARALFGALGLGLFIAWLRDGAIGLPRRAAGHFVRDTGVLQWNRWLPAIPATWVPTSWTALGGVPFTRLGLSMDCSLIMVGAGAIMGIRAGVSLLLAAVLGYGILAPIYIRKGDIVHPPPALSAAAGFTPFAQVESGEDLAFPLTVPAGGRLALSVETAGRPARSVVREWAEAREYKNRTALLEDLNAAAAANPFAGVVTFSVDGGRNRLLASTFDTVTAETFLRVDGTAGAPALGFPTGNPGRVLRYPIVLPPGAALTFELSQMTGPDTPMATESLKAEFAEGATFSDEAALLKGLNGPTLPGGAPNPFAGKVTFTIRRDALTATAAQLVHWDSALAVGETQGAELLGFSPGQKRSVPYGEYRNILRWLMWPGVAMMVTAGLLSFFLQWRTVLRAFSGLTAMFRRGPVATGVDPMAAVEVPGTWFAMGVAITGLAAVVLQIWFFGIHWWMGVLAVLMSFFLAIVACRATGETDITPVGAMGKITQLMYGGIAPGNMTANLMTANVTAGAATSSADLLQAMRCGYMVGASPRKQFIAMLLGVVVGSVVAAPAYNILIPSADVLGTDKLPAPAAQAWAGVALLLSNGFHALPVSARWGLMLGGLFGIVVTLCERRWPKSRKFLPSAAAMGIGFVVPAFQSVAMFLGALIAWILEKNSPEFNERYTISVASGFIAGESLMGIAVAMLVAFKLL